MTDKKLSELTELATTPANDDELYIRDVSEPALAESKRISVANLGDSVNFGGGHIIILPFLYDSIGQGTWTWGPYGGWGISGEWYNNEGNGDNCSYKVYLSKGTYSLIVSITKKGSNLGILDIDIDDVEVASFDCYAAGNVWGHYPSQAGIVVAASGLKTLKIRVDGKNPASSSYYMTINAIMLRRIA